MDTNYIRQGRMGERWIPHDARDLPGWITPRQVECRTGAVTRCVAFVPDVTNPNDYAR